MARGSDIWPSSWTPSTLQLDLRSQFQYLYILLAVFTALYLVIRSLAVTSSQNKQGKYTGILTSFSKFFYASFLKPHNGDGASTGQQAALESFYKAQVIFPFLK